jgi:DUF4097 and DUF4098 domain-containing protein YvlB
MSEERARILQMINEGKITAEEGVKLLNDLRSSERRSSEPGSEPTRWFRVRVTDLATGRTKVNVNLPLGLVKVGVKMGARYSPDIEEVDWDDIAQSIQEGAAGKIVDVEEHGQRVEVFVE